MIETKAANNEPEPQTASSRLVGSKATLELSVLPSSASVDADKLIQDIRDTTKDMKGLTWTNIEKKPLAYGLISLKLYGEIVEADINVQDIIERIATIGMSVDQASHRIQCLRKGEDHEEPSAVVSSVHIDNQNKI